MHPKEFLSLDVGQVRTGIARGSSVAKIAEPLETVPTDALEDRITELVKVNGVSAIVIGLPSNLSGDETPQTEWVRQWVKDLQSKIQLPLYWQDEALTSQAAESRKSKVKVDVDAEAAALLLQDFLNTPEEERTNV